MCVVTAFVAVCVCWWKQNQTIGTIAALFFTCFTAATIGRGTENGPVLWSVFAGILFHWIVAGVVVTAQTTDWATQAKFAMAASFLVGAPLGTFIGVAVRADERKRLNAQRVQNQGTLEQ